MHAVSRSIEYSLRFISRNRTYFRDQRMYEHLTESMYPKRPWRQKWDGPPMNHTFCSGRSPLTLSLWPFHKPGWRTHRPQRKNPSVLIHICQIFTLHLLRLLPINSVFVKSEGLKDQIFKLPYKQLHVRGDSSAPCCKNERVVSRLASYILPQRESHPCIGYHEPGSSVPLLNFHRWMFCRSAFIHGNISNEYVSEGIANTFSALILFYPDWSALDVVVIQITNSNMGSLQNS